MDSGQREHLRRKGLYDPNASERLYHRRWLMQFAGVAAILLIIVGGIAWYVYAGHQERDAKEVRGRQIEGDIEAHLAVVAEETKAEVEKALLDRNYADAKLALDRGGQKELPHEVWVDLDAEIKKSARAYRDQLLNSVDGEIEKGNRESAAQFLVQARKVEEYAGPDNRTYAYEEKIRQLARGQELEANRKLVERSRIAAEEGDFDKAIRLLGQAMQGPQEGEEVNLWMQALRERVGGRLQVDVNPANAWVHIPGRDRAKAGEVIVGLPQGSIRFTVKAEGYLPEAGQANVHYPSVENVLVELTPEAPGPLWATRSLSGQCAQRLAADYYLRKSKKASWREAVAEMAEPCRKKRKSPKKKELAKKAEGAIESFLKRCESDPLGALNGLGEFTAKYRRSVKLVLGNKRCSRALGKSLHKIENGCADCAGQGRQKCVACDGKSKRKELRTCKPCNGGGRKTHITCKGSGSVKCKRCKGRGTITKLRSRPGQPYKDRFDVDCPTCHRQGTVVCPRCDGGQIQCTKCKGAGRGKFMGDCLKCVGSGSAPCDICGETGDRRKMSLERRREVERDLSSMIGGRP